MSVPLVSVIITTYNHDKYIRSAIDGCLMQQTSFPFEIIIHDDASTDNTSSIVREYVEKHPDLIIPIIQEENQFSKGVKGAIRYEKYIKQLAKGKYIALCEGDDYWNHPNKLEIQVGFLENSVDYAGSAHQSLIISAEGERLFRKNVKKTLSNKDLLFARHFHTSSFIFRKEIFDEFSYCMPNVLSFDRLIFTMISAKGPIRYFNDVMCFYRKHKEGISSWVSYELMKTDFKSLKFLEGNIENFPKLKYLSFLHKICITYTNEKLPIKIIIRHYLLFFLLSFSMFPKNIKQILSTTYVILKNYLKNN